MTIRHGDQPGVDLARTAAVRLGGPGELLDLIPYLLGFHPRQSLVLVALRGQTDSRAGRVGAAVRLDLADLAVDPTAVRRAAGMVSRGADAVVAVVYHDDQPTGGVLPAAEAVEDVEREIEDAGVELRDALLAAGHRWWSYLCSSPDCCPPEGRPRGEGVSAAVAAATYAGLSVLPDRDALRATLEPEPDDLRSLRGPALGMADRAWLDADRRGTLGRRRTAVKRGLFAQVRLRATESEALSEMPYPAQLEEAALIRFGAALQDVAVRDACWLAMEARRLPHSSLWIEIARRLPAPYDAQPLFLHAWQSWRSGNGALAGLAAARALDSDPSCSAAALLLDTLAHGLDPRTTPRLRADRRRAG
jgi:hypothetical protein